ncbi:unnamed protein product [Adineta steineri]|nr:unnamed protein product [Adineta steineri]
MTTSTTTSTPTTTTSLSTTSSTTSSSSTTTTTQASSTTTTTTTTTTMLTCISSLTGATMLLNLTNSPSQNSYIQYSYNYIAVTTSTRLTLSFRMDSNSDNWSLDTLSVKRIGTSTELLTNGDFDSGTMSGWSSCNPNNATNFGFVHYNIYYPQSGYYYWKDASTGAVDYLYQYFSSVVGANYTISFYLKGDGDLPNSANVYIGS